MVFKASLDKASKVITILITLIFVTVIGGNVFLFRSGAYLVSIICILLMVGIYITVYLFRVTGYQITRDRLIVYRPLKNKIISRSDITRGRKVEKDELSWSLRNFGNGGFFGYTGLFSNKKIGAMRWYATRRDKGVLLQTNDAYTILLTPDAPEAFLEALKQ